MSDIWNELAQDILGNKEEKKERKRKLHELLDKYEDNIQALEDDVGADGIDYMFAKRYLDEVLDERNAQKERSVLEVSNKQKNDDVEDYALERFREEMKRRRQESVENVVKREDDEKDVENLSKLVYDVYRKSDAANSLKTGNIAVDFLIGRNKFAKAWNVGYNLGKAAFVAQQVLKERQKGHK